MQIINADLNTNRPLRERQLHLLDSLKEVCERHGLVYWIDFGTLLGAVRHKGFIPWDDDIDVSMPMSDFKKFLEFAEKELPRDVLLQTEKTDPAYKQAMAKLRDCRSTFLEHHETGNEKYHTGIYIDVFPSYYYPRMPYILRKILLRLTVRSRYKAHVSREKVWLNYPIYWACKVIWFVLKPLTSNKLGQIPEDNGYYYAISDEYVYPLKDVEFEGKMYAGPNNIDTYLTVMYGPNYMAPPPPEKRITHAKEILVDTPRNHPRSIHSNEQRN